MSNTPIDPVEQLSAFMDGELPDAEARFLLRRLDGQAGQLLREVHVLARAYGWREPDVLALTPRRRRPAQPRPHPHP